MSNDKFEQWDMKADSVWTRLGWLNGAASTVNIHLANEYAGNVEATLKSALRNERKYLLILRETMTEEEIRNKFYTMDEPPCIM